MFLWIVEEAAPGDGITGKDQGAFRGVIGNKKTVFAGGQILSFDLYIRTEFDGGIFIGACSPGRGFAGAETLIGKPGRNELSPDLSLPPFYAGAIIMKGDICDANAFADGGFFVAAIRRGGQLSMSKWKESE